MKLIDEACIEVIAGNGGNGSASFRREKFIPFGGPDGGDGGRGGSIIAIADENINTLTEYHYNRKFQAKNGEDGHGSDCYGRSAKNILLRFPVGTVIFNKHTHECVADLCQHQQTLILAKGGKGGLGNLHFKSSVNQTPKQKTAGEPGEQYVLRLELRILADIGLFGLPNAGKSTLITAISNARPKIAHYPFTTLSPNLGVVQINDSKTLVVADLPGLVVGASNGKGLGHRFLRHLERCHLLLHIIDLSAGLNETPDFIKQTCDLITELKLYNENLFNKPRWIVFNKIDILSLQQKNKLIQRLLKHLPESVRFFEISALTKTGCSDLLKAMMQYFIMQQTTSNLISEKS